MAQINNLIGPKSFELVRDRVAKVLSIEILNQSTLTGSTLSNAPVYTERFVPFSDTEMPAVNVMLARGDYGMYTAVNQDGTYIYNIDVYHKAKTTPDGRGDMRATKNLQQLVGVVQTILSHHRYMTLGFAPPFIERVEVRDIKFADPVNSKDSNSVVMARLTFAVRVPESISPDSAVLLDGYDTSVMIANSIDGYVFSGDGFPPVPPSCSPGQIRDENGVVLREVPSGGFVVLENNLIKNSDGSYSVELLPEQSLDLPNINITDSDGTLISYPSVKDFQCSPTVPPADATVTVNGNEFGTVESGEIIDISVVNGGSNPVGTIDGGQVVIADSFVQINGTTVGDIVAEDSLSIAVELDGVPSGTWNAMDQVWEVESAPCASATITLDSEPFLTVASGSTTDITLEDEDGNPVTPIGSVGNTIILPNAVEWQRPFDWLPIPSIANGEQVFYGLFAVYNVIDGNYVAFAFQGDYTVDWGDGVVESFASNVTATHQYSWTSVGNETTEGFRQALIKVTTQVGQNITQVNLQRAHPTLGNGRTSQFIDIVMNIPNVSGTNLTLGGATIVFHRIVKRVWIKEVGLLTSLGAAFSSMTSLESVPLFNTVSVTIFSNTFLNCASIKVVPLFNTISATSMTSMFNGCTSLSVIPFFNTINVITFQSMLAGCILLRQIPQFNTSSSNNLQTIVSGCSSLVLFEINSISITNTTSMFNLTPALQKVVLNGLTRGFSVQGCQMSATALNNLFTSLGTASGAQTITITGNPGSLTCNVSIATSKGFTVVIA